MIAVAYCAIHELAVAREIKHLVEDAEIIGVYSKGEESQEVSACDGDERTRQQENKFSLGKNKTVPVMEAEFVPESQEDEDRSQEILPVPRGCERSVNIGKRNGADENEGRQPAIPDREASLSDFQ